MTLLPYYSMMAGSCLQAVLYGAANRHDIAARTPCDQDGPPSDPKMHFRLRLYRLIGCRTSTIGFSAPALESDLQNEPTRREAYFAELLP